MSDKGKANRTASLIPTESNQHFLKKSVKTAVVQALEGHGEADESEAMQSFPISQMFVSFNKGSVVNLSCHGGIPEHWSC